MDLGTINSVSANHPRIHYGPAGGQGVAIEGARTAKTLGGRSPNLSGSGGQYTTDGLASLTAAPGVLGPTGDPMGLLVRANASGYAYTGVVDNFTAGRLTGRSVFLRRWTTGQASPHVMANMFVFGPGTFANAYVDLDAGVLTGVNAGDARLLGWGGGLYELQQWGTPGASAGGIVDVNVLGATDGHGHYFGCDCVSDGMPTTFFEGSKPGEVLTFDLDAIDYSANAGTLAVEFECAGGALDEEFTVFFADDQGPQAFLASNTVYIKNRADSDQRVVGALQPGLNKIAFTFKSGSDGCWGGSLNGAAPVMVYGPTSPFTSAEVELGSRHGGAASINDVIKSFAHAPRLFSLAELIEEAAA